VAVMSLIVPVGGGKGGTGKTFICGNLGIELARRGKRTLLIDLDLGAANLHTMIGLPLPAKNLSDFINRRIDTIDEAAVKTSLPNLFMISGARNDLNIANLLYTHKVKILNAVSRLDYDYILLDLGAGTAYNAIDFFMISTAGIMVAVPEPTSIENIYRMTRSLCFRIVRHIAGGKEFQQLLKDVKNRDPDGKRDYLETVLAVMKKRNGQWGDRFQRITGNFRLQLVMNQMREHDDQGLGTHISGIINKHLGVGIHFLGNIAFNNRVHDSICNRAAFVDKYPYTQTTTDIRRLSEEVLAAHARKHSIGTGEKKRAG